MIGEAPQPKDGGLIDGEKIHNEMLSIARTLASAGINPIEETYTQFGNNFFVLFQALKPEKSNLDPALVEKYHLKIKRAEKLYGHKWRKFFGDNAGLIFDIQEALKQLELSKELFRRYKTLVDNTKTNDLGDSAFEEMNLKDINAGVWHKLNPLLGEVSQAMARAGIRPEDFYG